MAKSVLEGGVSRADGVFLNLPGVGVVTWDTTALAVHFEWQGWANSTEFADLLEAGLHALNEHHGSRWLADCRNMKAIKQSDQDWIGLWFPRVLAAGLRRMAVVTPKSGLASMNIKDIVGRVPGTMLDVEHFATVEGAREWLTRPATSPPTAR
ncbi:MAG TPA: STAS/SEC14 domain-containing protein [Candidatus Dormibacteraeota bacterium]|nr:STAS/SEC14 domain-containing protein [Candidatus Dormibacteraeota bacterium]